MTLSASTFIVLIVLWMVTVGLGIATALNVFDIVDAVNGRLPEKDRIDLSSIHIGKRLRLHREYRRLYPTGKLLQRQGKLGAYMLACCVVAALLLMGPLVAVIAGCFGGFGLWFGYFRIRP
jgi:hypothetical protein